jgi:hypothetical protein
LRSDRFPAQTTGVDQADGAFTLNPHFFNIEMPPAMSGAVPPTLGSDRDR